MILWSGLLHAKERIVFITFEPSINLQMTDILYSLIPFKEVQHLFPIFRLHLCKLELKIPVTKDSFRYLAVAI